MLVSLQHSDRQVLRAVLRAEAVGTTPLGRDLRLAPTRGTKDGTFLDELVKDGLLAVVGKPVPPADGVDVPQPFRVRYKLTALGKHAAEYGEYQRAFTPAAKPVSGTAGELWAALESKSFRPKRGK